MTNIADWGSTLWTSFANAMNMFFAFIPKLLGFLVILIIGLIVASLLAKAVTLLLRKIGFDEFSDRLGMAGVERRLGTRIDMAEVLGKIVYWFVFLIFLVPAINALELTTVSVFLTQLISYIPNVFVAVLVLFLGLLISNFVGDLVRRTTTNGRIGNPNLLSNLARYAIIGFALIIALQQLNIAPELFQILFSAVVGALALALGLAFGLGGKDAVQRWFSRNEDRFVNASSNSGGVIPQTQGTTMPPQTPDRQGRSRPEQYRNIS